MATKKFTMTKKQYEVLAYLRDYMADKPIAPSYDEIAAECGLSSKSGVSRMIKALEERGHIQRIPNRARAIVLL